jgi:hypothetical protein
MPRRTTQMDLQTTACAIASRRRDGDAGALARCDRRCDGHTPHVPARGRLTTGTVSACHRPCGVAPRGQPVMRGGEQGHAGARRGCLRLGFVARCNERRGLRTLHGAPRVELEAPAERPSASQMSIAQRAPACRDLCSFHALESEVLAWYRASRLLGPRHALTARCMSAREQHRAVNGLMARVSGIRVNAHITDAPRC